MMSPYEGERIFEAEMVRQHQCDRQLYAACPRGKQAATPGFSLRQWVAGLWSKEPALQQPVDASVESRP